MKKIILMTIMVLLSAVTTAKAQEKFENKTLALMENIAMNSEQKNVVEFLKKADYEKVSESEEDGGKTYYFMGPNSYMMKIEYNKSKKLVNIIMRITSDFPVIIDIQTNLVQHGFVNRDYKQFHFAKSSYPYKFLTMNDEDNSSAATIYLLTKYSENYQK